MTQETAMVVLTVLACAIATGFLSMSAKRSAHVAVTVRANTDERVARMLAARHASGEISTHDYERILAVIRT